MVETYYVEEVTEMREQIQAGANPDDVRSDRQAVADILSGREETETDRIPDPNSEEAMRAQQAAEAMFPAAE